MGQYHVVANLDKREYIHPHPLGSGLKLREMLWNHPGICEALIILLACSNGRGGGDIEEDPLVGRWAGDRIAVVGDYAEDRDLPPEFEAASIYHRCGCEEEPSPDAYRDITEQVARLIEQEFQGRYIGSGWRDWKPEGAEPVRQIGIPDMVLRFPRVESPPPDS